MLIDPALLTSGWRLATAALALPALAYAAYSAPWRTWLQRTDRQHVWLGSIVGLAALWSLRAGITPGLSFQFLLVAAFTLMHGWRLALLGLAVVLGAECALHGGWTAWAANFLCFALVPVAFVTVLHRVVERYLPNNYFVFFFVTVFAGSMVAFNLAGFARLVLLAANGTLDVAHVGDEYLVFLPMMSFGEAFMNGLVMSIAVVYRPEWVASFDDRRYLRR